MVSKWQSPLTGKPQGEKNFFFFVLSLHTSALGLHSWGTGAPVVFNRVTLATLLCFQRNVADTWEKPKLFYYPHKVLQYVCGREGHEHIASQAVDHDWEFLLFIAVT